MDHELLAAAEVIKEERLFGTFNTEDILTSPACELSDSISVENEQSKEQIEQLSWKSKPNAMGCIIQSAFEEAFDPTKKERGASEFTSDDIKIEDDCEIIKPSTSFGLKIADFAVDPDSCAILSEISSQVTNHPSLTDNLSASLNKISFSNIHRQLEKLYHVLPKAKSSQVKANYIITSHPEQNNTRTDWKLFIPLSPPLPFHPGYLANLNVTKNGKHFDLKHAVFNHQFNSINLTVMHVEDLYSFHQCISDGHLLMITKENLLRITKLVDQLIPHYSYMSLGITDLFETEISELGYETGGPIITMDSMLYKKIVIGLNNHYPPGVKPRVRTMARLMENDLNKKNIHKSEVNKELKLVKLTFISQIKEYPKLANYPDILYQILRKTLLSLKPVTDTTNITPTSTNPLMQSHNQLTSIPTQAQITQILQCCLKKKEKKNHTRTNNTHINTNNTHARTNNTHTNTNNTHTSTNNTHTRTNKQNQQIPSSDCTDRPEWVWFNQTWH